MTNSIKSILLASVLLVAPLAANAEIRICPITGRPYDTTHGRNVDEPGTAEYVAPENRPNGSSSRRSSRSTNSAPGHFVRSQSTTVYVSPGTTLYVPRSRR